MATLRIAATVRQRLASALVEETVLAEALRAVRPRPLEGVAERFVASVELLVPRVDDPEFAERLAVSVILDRRGADWDVVAVDGLPDPIVPPSE